MIKLLDILNEAEIPVTGKSGEKVAAFKPKKGDEAFERGYKSIKRFNWGDLWYVPLWLPNKYRKERLRGKRLW